MEMTDIEERKLTAVVDTVTKLPACVLLQAVYGGNREVCQYFDEWVLAPTPNMAMVTGTLTQWKNMAKVMNAKGKKG